MTTPRRRRICSLEGAYRSGFVFRKYSLWFVKRGAGTVPPTKHRYPAARIVARCSPALTLLVEMLTKGLIESDKNFRGTWHGKIIPLYH